MRVAETALEREPVEVMELAAKMLVEVVILPVPGLPEAEITP